MNIMRLFNQLIICLVSVLLSVFPTVVQAQSKKQDNHHHKVIIIGAGMAGISAAAYLQSHGVKDFVILEARSRIGGRMWSFRPKSPIWGNSVLDLGAVFIHKAHTNPLMKLVKQWSIDTVVVDPENTAHYNANDRQMPEQEELKIDRLYQKFNRYLVYRQENDSIFSRKSVSDVVVRFIQKYRLNRAAQADLLYLVTSNIESEYAADISRLSSIWFDNDSEFVGPEKVLPAGYGQLTNHLAKPLNSRIMLNYIVKAIDYRNRKNIVITTNAGERFTTPYVICTVPIGVLQHKRIAFKPSLPKNKRRAINRDIGVGVYNHLYLLFPTVFWDNANYIELVPNAYWTGKQWKNKGQWISFTNFYKVKHMPILEGSLTGMYAIEMQDKPKSVVVDAAMAALRKIYGPKIPLPLASVLSTWGKDPFSDGAYTSLRPGALPDSRDYKIMALPVKGHLLFAGEGTSAKYPGTVHGAYLSGQRAGRFVFSRLK